MTIREKGDTAPGELFYEDGAGVRDSGQADRRERHRIGGGNSGIDRFVEPFFERCERDLTPDFPGADCLCNIPVSAR